MKCFFQFSFSETCKGNSTSYSYAVYPFNSHEMLTFHFYVHTQHNTLTHLKRVWGGTQTAQSFQGQLYFQR